jgi:hypothetical protein
MHFLKPETFVERSRNSKTEMVSTVANLPLLMMTIPVDIKAKIRQQQSRCIVSTVE